MPVRSVHSMTAFRIRMLVGAVALIGLVLVLYLVMALRSGSTAAPGTTVGGVDIGGMTQEEAASVVANGLGTRESKKLRVKALDQTFVVEPAEAGLSLDATASVAPAFTRSWSPAILVSRLTGGVKWPAVPAVDDAALHAQVQLIADALDVAAVEPTLTVSGKKPMLTDGVSGQALDEAATEAALTDALLQPRKPIQATVLKVEPTVSDESAQAALVSAQKAVSAPVTVNAESVTAAIPAGAIGRALSYTVVDGELVPSLDGTVLHQAISKELRPIEIKGRNATFKIRGGKPKVVKSKVGRGVSDDELASAVSAVLDGSATDRTVTVSVGLREPKLTTDEAKQLGVTEKLGGFTQNFPYAAYRVQNIGEAARRMNGTLLMPGDTFSLNDTIKERTEKNGYTVGYVIGEGGVFDEALGGGVSTAATTVWTAAFYSGMERVQNIAHSIYISRYQPGLEATVAWGLFDMKFRNNSPDAVFITASTTNTSVTVSMWGTKVYDKIEADFGKRTDIKKFSTIYDKSDTCLGQGGVEGFSIVVDRVFYQDGKEVKREPIKTTYKPAPEVICGKKPAKNPDETGASPSASPTGKPTAKPSAKPSDDTFSNPTPSATKPGKPNKPA